MPDGRRPMIVPTSTSLSADQVARRRFAIVRKGFDPSDVEAFLEWVAAGIEAASQREEELKRKLQDAERRASSPEIDEATVTAVLGQETARIIRSAHDAAAEVTARATETADRIVRDAETEAREVEQRASAMLEEKAREAEESAAGARQAARDEAARHLQDARREAEEIREAARGESREMIREAQELRGRILGDMARRRRVLLTQVEQLRAGRGSLSEAVEHVRRAVEEIHAQLQRAEDDARGAAEAAARRAVAEPEPSIEQLHKAAGMAPQSTLSGGPAGRTAAEEGAGPPEPVTEARPAGARAEEAGQADEHQTGARAAEAGQAEEHQTEAAGAGAGAVAGGIGPETGAAEGGAPRTGRAEAAPPAPLAEPEDAWPTSDEDDAAPQDLSSGPDDGDVLDDNGEEGGEDRRMSSFRIIRRSRRARQAREMPTLSKVLEGRHAPDEPAERQGPSAAAARMPDQEAEGRTSAATTSSATTSAATTSAGTPDPAGATAERRSSAATIAAERVEAIFAQIRASREGTGDVPTAGSRTAGEGAPGRDNGGSAVAAAGRSGESEGAPVAALQGGAGSDAAEASVSSPARADEALLQRRDNAIEPHVPSLSRRLKRALQDDQNDALDRLRASRARTAEAVLAPRDDQVKRLEEVAVAAMERAAEEGAQFAGGRLKEKSRRNISDDQSRQLAQEVVLALRARLEDRFDELAAGDDAGIVDHIGAAYREWKGSRVERLAGDHLAAAFSRGVLAGAVPGTSLRWIVDDDGIHCPDCDDNALAGPLQRGDRYPTGQSHPPAHAGCRCLLVPNPA